MSVSTPWRPRVLLNRIFAHSAKMYLNKSHKTFLSCWEHQNTKTTPFAFHADFWWYCWFQSPDSTFFRVASGSPKWPKWPQWCSWAQNLSLMLRKSTQTQKLHLNLTFCLLLSLSVPLVRIVNSIHSNLFSATPSQLLKTMNWNIQAHLNAWGLKLFKHNLCASLPLWFWRK